MWSKTRLNDRLADSLKGKVDYVCEGFSTRRHHVKKGKGMDKWWTVYQVFFIKFDGKKVFATNPNGYCGDYLKDMGEIPMNYAMEGIHHYLNEADIEECLSGENVFLFMLAILDRRVGKRKIKEIVGHMDDGPGWMKPFIRFRAEAEGIRFPE